MFTRSLAISLGACVLAICAAAPAAAAEKQGWYVGTGVGSASNTMSGINWGSGVSEKTNATGFKMYGGYQFNPYLAVELQYVDFGEYKADQGSYHGTVKTSGLGMSAVGLWPLSDQFSLFGKLGAISKMRDYKEDDRAYRNEGKSTKVAALLGVGAEYRFTTGLSLRAEYEHAGKTGLGDDDAKLANKLLSVGVRYQF